MTVANTSSSEPSEPSEPSSFTAVFLFAALCLLVLGIGLALLLPPDLAQAPAELAARFVGGGAFSGRDGLHPEPKERTIFVSLTLAAPLLVLLGARVLRGRRSPAWVTRMVGLFVVGAAAIVVTAVWSPLGALVDWLGPLALSCVLVTGLLALAAARALPARRLTALGLACGAAASTLGVVAIKGHGFERLVDWAPDEIHLEAFLFPIAQSAAGRHCLVDYVPQYGCYGELLAPAVRALGSTLDAVAWLMIALTLAGLWALWAFLLRVLSAPLLAVLAPSVVLLSWTVGATKVPADVHDAYYQYFPVRFVFPALSLLAGSLWSRPSRRLAAGYGLLAGLALLWNPDSGVAVVGALLAVIAFDLLPRRAGPQLASTLGRLVAYVLALALALGAFEVVLRLQSGAWPALGRLFGYAEIFYLAGFHMVPMPLGPSCWQVVVGVHLALLALSVTGRRDAGRARTALQLAVLGLGLFAYYSGRSLPATLAAVSWPAVLGAALLLDRVPRLEQRAAAALAAWTALALSLSAALALSLLALPVPSQLRSLPRLRQHVSFVADSSRPSTRLALFAMHQGAILLHAGRAQALRAPGLAELALVEDLEAIRAQLRAGRVELAYLDRDLAVMRPTLFAVVRAELLSSFRLEGVSADGRLERWSLHAHDLVGR